MSGALHDGTYTNMWMTDLGPQNAVLTFDLGSVYSLGAISLWNYNTDFGMGYSLARGVKDFTIELSTDGLDFTAALGDTLDKGTGMPLARSEEHTSELQSLMRISYAVFCLKKNTKHTNK